MVWVRFGGVSFHSSSSKAAGVRDERAAFLMS